MTEPRTPYQSATLPVPPDWEPEPVKLDPWYEVYRNCRDQLDSLPEDDTEDRQRVIELLARDVHLRVYSPKA